MKSPEDLNKDLGNVEKKVKEFSELLDSIETTEDKKKLLWREIYENAVVDRLNSYMLFVDVYTNMSGQTTDHLQLGPILAKYLERMNKSNDQLLKLADLISKEEEKAAKIDPDDLFKTISGG